VAEGGAPSQKTFRAAANPEPLAEGGFVFRRLIIPKASLAMPLKGRGGLAAAAAGTAFALVAALPAPALAERVKVRVEGKTTTIFGSAEPTLTTGPNALAVLDAASLVGEFYYHVSPGPFVDQIGRYPGAGFSGWSYKVNGVSPPVAADQAPVKGGDTVLWYWTTFSEQGSTPTLLLRRRAKANCYSVVSQNDKGLSTAASNAVLSVDGRRVRARSGRACVGRHRGLVRATAPNAVRSNALR
jgi:Domain of unknown function (DUF4430)